MAKVRILFSLKTTNRLTRSNSKFATTSESFHLWFWFTRSVAWLFAGFTFIQRRNFWIDLFCFFFEKCCTRMPSFMICPKINQFWLGICSKQLRKKSKICSSFRFVCLICEWTNIWWWTALLPIIVFPLEFRAFWWEFFWWLSNAWNRNS